MLTSWHFRASGDILGQNMLFGPKMLKTGIALQNSIDSSMVRNFAWFISERVLNKTFDAIINEKIALILTWCIWFRGRGQME